MLTSSLDEARDDPECNRRVVVPAADCGDSVPTIEERVAALEGKVQAMDNGLKQHFAEFRTFVVESLDDVEKRLTARFTEEITEKVGGLETRLGARLDRVDTRLDNVDARFNGIDTRLDGIDTKLDILVRAIGGGGAPSSQ